MSSWYVVNSPRIIRVMRLIRLMGVILELTIALVIELSNKGRNGVKNSALGTDQLPRYVLAVRKKALCARLQVGTSGRCR